MGLIYKGISYISPKTKKYCIEEINIRKDAKSCFGGTYQTAELSSGVELLTVTELITDAELTNPNGSQVE